MPRARSRPPIVPRILNDAGTATYLGKSQTWFAEHREELEARGFPKRLPFVDGRDKAAIDAWLDQLGGLASRSDADFDNAWMEAANV